MLFVATMGLMLISSGGSIFYPDRMAGASRSHAMPSLEQIRRRYSAAAPNAQTSLHDAPTTTSQPW